MTEEFDLVAYVKRLEKAEEPSCPFCSIPLIEIRPGVMTCPMDLDLDTALRLRVALVIEHELSTQEAT